MAKRRRSKAKPKRRAKPAKAVLRFSSEFCRKEFTSAGAAKRALKYACRGDRDATVTVRNKIVGECPAVAHRSDDGPMAGSRRRRRR